MIGLVASTCAMTTMAAPSFDHKKSSAPHHQINKKHQPHKHAMNRGPQHKSPNHHFNKNDHRSSFQHNMKHGNGPQHRQPPKHH